MLKNIISKNLIIIIVLCLTFLSVTNCAAQTVRISDTSDIVAIAVFKLNREDGSISTVFLDKEGNPVPQCLICSLDQEKILQQNFQLTCEEAAKKGVEINGNRICRSLTGATLKRLDSLNTAVTNHDLFFTRIGPGNMAQEIPIPHSH